MDVFHKVLSRIYNDTGGKEKVKADMAEILKQEGFFPSLEEITSHMVKEGWITEAGSKHSVFITHWGVAEAKKSLKNKPDMTRAIEKDSKQLISNAKQFVVVAEEFADEPTIGGLKLVDQQISDLRSLIDKIRAGLD